MAVSPWSSGLCASRAAAGSEERQRCTALLVGQPMRRLNHLDGKMYRLQKTEVLPAGEHVHQATNKRGLEDVNAVSSGDEPAAKKAATVLHQ